MLQTATIIFFEWSAVALMTFPLFFQARKLKRYQSIVGFSSETILLSLFSSLSILIWCDSSPYFITQASLSIFFDFLILKNFSKIRKIFKFSDKFFAFKNFFLYFLNFFVIFSLFYFAVFVFLGAKRTRDSMGVIGFAIDAVLPLPQIILASETKSLFAFSISRSIGRIAGHIILLSLLHIFSFRTAPVGLWQVLTYFSLIPDSIILIMAFKYGRGHRNEQKSGLA